MFDEFEVNTEDELFEKLVEDSKTIPCTRCGKERNFEELEFPDGDPICIYCINGEN